MNGRQWLSLLFRISIAIAASSVTHMVASGARAQDTAVTLLGVRSLDGEAQLERRLSQAMRVAAKAIDGYRISDREVSLAQMALAHGCEEVDPPCLTDIAETLEAERLLYGSLVRSGDKVRISLFNFAASSGQVDATAERTVANPQLVEPALSEIMAGLVQRLSGKRSTAVGTLRITGNRPGASVAVDGKPAGKLDSEGELLIPQVGEGRHTVTVVTSDGRDRRELSVEVRGETTTTLRALLTPPLPAVRDQPGENRYDAEAFEAPAKPARSWKRIAGWTSVGIATGLAAATIYSWVRIKNIGESEALAAYSARFLPGNVPGGTDDSCREAINRTLVTRDPTNVQNAILEDPARALCQEAQTLEKLQWVFLSGTLAFGGLGTFLLLTAPKKPATTLSLSPSFGHATGGLNATLRF